MRLQLPDGLIYAVVVGGLLVASIAWRGSANAPSTPPPVPGLGQTPIASFSPFAADRVLPATPKTETAAGTAFSIGDAGLWLTARHVIDGCDQIGVVVAEGRGVAASIAARRGDLAVLRTEGGAPALPLAPSAPRAGQQVFHPGFPQGAPGEVASQLLGRQTLRVHGRGVAAAEVLAWAENGRTDGLRGSLAGLSGAPVLDATGRVVGVTLAESPRRGRLYSSTPRDVREMLSLARAPTAGASGAQPLSVDSYGRAADDLRRQLRVVQVVCLAA
ncbi:MAG TPA: serine protease [Caulobacteraceae bacterium]|jgi:S1-C subfamily serine protease